MDFGQSYITSLGTAAFATNNAETGSLTNFTFPSYIGKDGANKTNIGEYCLAGRDNLDYVTIPDNITGNLDDTIFFDCTGLECVTFGEGCQNTTYNSSVDGDSNTHNTMFYSVANQNFYVKGPKNNAAGKAASPRVSTWSALYDYAATGNEGRHVPYVYVEGGKEYYEVSDGNYLMVIDKETGELISCTFPQDKTPVDIDKFTIPAVVGTTTVTGIKEGCFVGDTTNVGVLDYIVNLVIEDGSNIATLDDNTFAGADKMETAYIGDSITSIGKGAFEDCPKLREVTIAENINSIGDNTFQNCPKLEDITFEGIGDKERFPEGNIGSNAFNTKGTKLTIHGDIAPGYAPFEWATDTDNFANANQSIRTLYKTPAPTSLSVILDNQNGLVTLVDYPHYEYLDRYAYDVTEDKLIELPAAPGASDPYYGQTVKDKIDSSQPLNLLEEQLVKNCSNLVIPEGVESIDVNGFFNDTSLNPNNVDKFSNKASADAYFNKAITPYNTYSSIGLFNGYYGNEAGDNGAREYPKLDPFENVDKGNDRLTSIEMHDVVYLPDKAFESCENLETAYIGKGIKDVGARPFAGCTGVTSVAFGNPDFTCENGIIYENVPGGKNIIQGLESIGTAVGPGYEDINLSNNPSIADVVSMDDNAFENCLGLETVDLTEAKKLESIPKECFLGCENLTEVDFGNEVDEIGERAFHNTGDGLKVIDRTVGGAFLDNDTNGPVGDKVKNATYLTYKTNTNTINMA